MPSKIIKNIRKDIPILYDMLFSIRTAIMSVPSYFKIHKLLKRNEQIFLEVGAGDKIGSNGWHTIDITGNCDIFWDLRKGIPFPSNTISKIYSSHFFEHLSYNEIVSFLAECKRVLVKDGIFSICIPNAKLYIEAYINSNSLDNIPFLEYSPALNNTTKIDYINYIAYMDGQHKYMFDNENIIQILNSCGFRNARLREFDPKLDMSERITYSLFAEANK